MKEKILIIHPEDRTTDFLKDIYKRVQCQGISLISYPAQSSSFIRDCIKKADIVILLGHGTEYGLLSDAHGKRFSRYIINSKNVEELRKKKLVIGVWCNANIFFDKYRIPGFCTGMFISEEQEAIEEGYGEFVEEIDQSNNLFVSILRDSLPGIISGKITLENLLEKFNKDYVSGPIAKFNLSGFLISKDYE